MRVIALTRAAAGESLVVDAEAGRLSGTWRGDQLVPIGGALEIELNVSRALRWSEVHCDNGELATRKSSGAVAAKVVVAYEDGVHVLQIGDAITMVEFFDAVPTDAVGRDLWIPRHAFEFYPVQL